MTKKKITHSDSFQKSYSYYLSEPTGRNFDPDFNPELTPKEMLKLGVFGGAYFIGGKPEFPESWFTKSKLNQENNKDKTFNYFQVDASMPLDYWKKKGWIHPDDPHGWFQWYCRYYWGRRHPDDERQIRRWRQMTRHIAQVKKNCVKGDDDCRPKQKQALLHWAYDSRQL